MANVPSPQIGEVFVASPASPTPKKQKDNELKEISHLENMLDCKLNDLRICSSTAPSFARIFPQNQGFLVSTNNSWVRTLEVGLIDVDMDMVD